MVMTPPRQLDRAPTRATEATDRTSRPARRCDGILDAVGETPLVRLRRLFPDSDLELWAKLEAVNPGGSMKDRPAREILREGLASGRIGPDTVIIESSSGNMGVGLAQACRYHDLRLICVVDPKASPSNVGILRAYGAEVDCVREPDPETGEYLQARLHRVEELVATIDGAYWPNQYSNLLNPAAHYKSTMREIAEAFDGRVDYVFVATSTCGTLRGCREYIDDHGLSTQVIAVDAVGSLIFGRDKRDRKIPGLGASMQPPHSRPGVPQEFVQVTDEDCVRGCRMLVRREAILAGGSSGGVIRAIDLVRHRLPGGSVCVAILPDRGERYLRTVYDDAWVERLIGED